MFSRFFKKLLSLFSACAMLLSGCGASGAPDTGTEEETGEKILSSLAMIDMTGWRYDAEGVTDLKAAIRYIRYTSGLIPGDSTANFIAWVVECCR